MSSPVTMMSYDDLAERLGIERESARRLVVRKHWRRIKGNDGKARIEVPSDELPARVTGPVPGDHQGQNTRQITGLDDDAQSPDDTGEARIVAPSVSGQVPGERPVDVTVLARHIDRLEAELMQWRTKASDRDLLAGQLEGLRLVLEELRRDRDEWRRQAQTLALPDQTKPGAPATVPSVTLEPRRPWWRRLAG